MNANNHFANRNQTILFFQPRFGYIDINGENSRWLHHDKGLYTVPSPFKTSQLTFITEAFSTAWNQH